MPLGMEVGLSPGDNVLDGNPAPPPPKGAQPPNFWPMSVVARQLDGSNATWFGGRPQPRPHCVTWGPSSPPKRGTFPNFQPMFIVAKRSPILATAVHL